MTESPEIRGGATEFEAAVVAVILDRIAREEKAAAERRTEQTPVLSAWVRAVRPDPPEHPLDMRRPVW